MARLLLHQERWHAVVDFRYKIVRRSDKNHRAGLQALAGLEILPLIPKPGRREDWRAIARREIPRLFSARCVLCQRRSKNASAGRSKNTSALLAIRPPNWGLFLRH
jgi:hypothetical protein